MAITGIDHLYVETRSFQEACAFWEGLGFRLAESWGEDGHRAGRLVSSDAAIVLAEAESPCPPTVHFRLADPVPFAEQVSGNPLVTVTLPLQPTHWGTQWLRVQDTDGHAFALEAPLS